MMLSKAYVRFREQLPINETAFAAADGFDQMGVSVVPYYGFGDIEELHAKGALTRETIVCGYIGDLHKALCLLGMPSPPPLDYPEHLQWMLGREVKRDTLGAVRASVAIQFVKPVQQKLFTGLVWDPADTLCRIKLAAVSDETECFTSDVVDFVSEWRCFVRENRVVGVKNYRGDWSEGFDRETLLKAVHRGIGKMPKGHALDVGMTHDGRTLLVEATEGFSVGAYGLPSVVYARLLESRWAELMGTSVG